MSLVGQLHKVQLHCGALSSVMQRHILEPIVYSTIGCVYFCGNMKGPVCLLPQHYSTFIKEGVCEGVSVLVSQHTEHCCKTLTRVMDVFS